MSTPSPVSDESTTTEGTVLREFVDQAIAQKRVATMSPRSALLSQSSLQAPTADARSSQATNEGGDAGRQVRKRSTGSRRMRGMEVARPSTLAQLMDVDLSRKDPKDEVMRLREILKTVERHSVLEARRAKELERANQEAERRMQVFAENQLHEKQEALKAHQEVRLVQLQLQNAQEEIERKQREMRRVERQRDDAEAEAARAREKARKLHEQTVAAAAREEGRRLGFQAGFDYASQERRILAARRPANPPAKRRTTPRRTDTVESHTVESHITAGSSKGKQRAVEHPPPSVNTSAFRPSRSEPQSQQYSQYGHPASQPSLSERQPPPAPVAQYYVPPSPAANDNVPGPEDEMSPSQLGLRSLPAYDTYSERPPSRRSGPSQSTPHRRFAPPPEVEPDREEPPPAPDQYPPPPNQYLAAAHEPPQLKTPAIEVYEIEMPSAEQLNREYSFSQENSSEAIPNMPREQWVPAATFHERRGTRAPPALKLPPSQPQPWRPAPKPQQQPAKSVKFPNILSRPSLLKTKEQASSWYRSLSWRKKSKPVIDPIPEEGTTPISAGPFTGSTYDDSQPPIATDPPDTAESQGMYGGPHPPRGSWYQAKQPLIPPNGPASMRSGYTRVRAISDAASVSTRVSQFDLLATPHPNAPPAMSVRSGKEGARKLKEKESYLSAIIEDPASRNNTPSRAPRPSEENMRSMASVLSQPNFGNHPVQQQASYGTLDGTAQNNRRQRRMPPAIAVPDPDQELEPFGVAYNRGAVANGYQPYAGADLNRRPSRISERTTPDTSIGIDIVPPSGFAPDAAQSPPHTGRNHLSPYHTYSAAAPLFQQSIESLRVQASRPNPPAPERPISAAASRRKSKQSFTGYPEPPHDHYQRSPAMSNTQPRPPSAASRPASSMHSRAREQPNGGYSNADYARPPTRGSAYPESVRSNTRPSHPDYARASAAPVRPESVRSAAQRNVPPYASQTSLSNLTGGGGVLGQPRNASASRLVLASPVHRVASNTSMRSQGSYARFDPNRYDDPAFWSADGPLPPPPVEEHAEGYFDRVPPSRAQSVNSGLSYISDPNQ